MSIFFKGCTFFSPEKKKKDKTRFKSFSAHFSEKQVLLPAQTLSEFRCPTIFAWRRKKGLESLRQNQKKEIILGKITTQRPVSIFDWVNRSYAERSPASLQIKFTMTSTIIFTWFCPSTSVQYVDVHPSGTVAMLITIWIFKMSIWKDRV